MLRERRLRWLNPRWLSEAEANSPQVFPSTTLRERHMLRERERPPWLSLGVREVSLKELTNNTELY